MTLSRICLPFVSIWEMYRKKPSRCALRMCGVRYGVGVTVASVMGGKRVLSIAMQFALFRGSISISFSRVCTEMLAISKQKSLVGLYPSAQANINFRVELFHLGTLSFNGFEPSHDTRIFLEIFRILPRTFWVEAQSL
jgi:hypothetical protein